VQLLVLAAFSQNLDWEIILSSPMNLAYCMEECKDTKPRKPRTGFLAAGLKLAAVSDGDAEVFVRIDGSVVDANFVVKMWTGGAALRPT